MRRTVVAAVLLSTAVTAAQAAESTRTLPGFIAINAKGACIGEMGRRVRAVTEELGGEKIDIVRWNE